MTSPKRLKPHRIVADLSDGDHKLLTELVAHEKDTVSNVLRRMIRSHYRKVFAPKPKALTLRLPESSGFTLNNERDPK